jgi:hypothetical protein
MEECGTEVGKLAVIERYADRLITEGFPPLDGANPENIGSGAGGIALFLLELYAQTRKERHLRAAERLIDDILVWCREHPTNNYALYTGRCGAIYVLMQYYVLTGNDAVIKECLELIRPANREYLHSRYTTDYLYDGRAGTLLTLLHLFLITSDGSLLACIHEFSQKIICNARMHAGSLFWNAEEEYHLKPPCGFAHGTSGVQYVLTRLAQIFPNPTLEFVLRALENYHDTCWVEEFRNWGNFRKPLQNNEALNEYKTAYLQGHSNLLAPKDDCFWADGATGMLFSSLIRENAKMPGNVNHRFKEIIDEGCASGNLYDGLAGLGLYLLHTSGDTGSWELQEIISLLTARLVASGLHTDGGLFHSDLGCLYFLLKATGTNPIRENILTPFLYEDVMPAGRGRTELPLDLNTVVKGLLAKNYPRTVYLLESVAPTFFKNYQPGGDGSSFAHCIENWTALHLPAAIRDRLMDLFSLEKEEYLFLMSDDRSAFQIYLDTLFHHVQVLEYLNRPDEWLLQQSVAISSKVKLLRSRWDWSFIDDFQRMQRKKVQNKFLLNLTSSPGSFEYLIQVSDKFTCGEVMLRIESLPGLKCFEGFRSIADFVIEVRHLLLSLPGGELRNILEDNGALRILSSSDFLKLLDTVILRQIRSALLKNILTIKEDTNA